MRLKGTTCYCRNDILCRHGYVVRGSYLSKVLLEEFPWTEVCRVYHS